MAFVTTTTTTQAESSQAAEAQQNLSADAALLLMGALAGASMTKAARKEYRKLQRKMAWKALGLKFKSMFSRKHQASDQIFGMDAWLFILLVLAGAAIGFAIFGVWGFLVLLGLGAIIYLLLRNE